MNDFASDIPDTVSMPDSAPASSPIPGMSRVELANDPAVNDGRQTTLVQLAKDEKIDGYVAERTDQSDVFDKGREISDDRKAKWYKRASTALNDAANEKYGIKSNGLPSQEKPEFIPQSARSDEYYPEAFDPDHQRKEGAAAERG
jgi:hypothetical protein